MGIYRGIGGTGDSNTDATVTAVTAQAVIAVNAAAGAALSVSNSATNASNSGISATASANSATASANSATTSGNSAAASANSAAQSAASYDSFDDRYLGAKATAPTTDNDGGVLIVGALYFNTVDLLMKVWGGSVWIDSYASLSGVLIDINNLSDLDNAATARTNLGLGTAATTAATAYATAAQGTLADSATQPADLATVATSGSYTDLTSTPTLGTAAATASTDYATAAQGSTADSATQPADLSAAILVAVPAQTGNSGEFLTTNGTVTSWATVDALPDQTGNSGEYLTTDGTVASWAVLDLTTKADVGGANATGTWPIAVTNGLINTSTIDGGTY